jgi:cation diffusion facilitator family transporter
MELLSTWLAKKLVSGKQGDPEALSRIAAITTIVVNLVLFIAKLFTGIAIASMALVADSLDSLFDVLIAGVMWFGFRVAFKPADSEHPFGHGRFEHVATLILAMFLTLTGISIAYASIQRLSGEPKIQLADWALFVIVINVLLKFFLVRFSMRLNLEIESGTIEANVWNLFGDVLSSLVVLVSLLVYRFTGFPHLDACASLFISAMILSVAVKFFKEASSTLMGKAVHTQDAERIQRIAEGIEGVKGVHGIAWHSYGRKHVVSMHLEIDKNLTVGKAHRITQEVERSILGTQRHIQSLVIHVDPATEGGCSKGTASS